MKRLLCQGWSLHENSFTHLLWHYNQLLGKPHQGTGWVAISLTTSVDQIDYLASIQNKNDKFVGIKKNVNYRFINQKSDNSMTR